MGLLGDSSRFATTLVLLTLAACNAAPAAPAAKAPAPPSGASSGANSAPAPVSAPAAAAPASPPPTENIRLTFAAHSAAYAPFHIAIDKGYFAEEGLTVEAINAPGAVGTPAIISGEVDYSSSAASSLSAILKGAPLKIIYTNVDRPGYELWATSPEVQSVADLPGKSIGILSRGDSSEVAVRMFLQQRGIDPNAVTFAALGGSAQTLAAAQAGQMGAVALGTAEAVRYATSVPRERRIADLKRELKMLYMGLTTSDRELQGHNDRVKRVLRATLKGREYFRTYRDETLALMAKYNESPREANEADYDDVVQSLTEDGSLASDVAARDAAIRAELNGVETVPSPDQMYDYSLVKAAHQELVASGWKPTR